MFDATCGFRTATSLISRPNAPSLALATAFELGGLISLALFFVALGVREDITQALATWRFDLKIGLVLLALGSAFSLCLALSRPVPSGRPGRRLLPLAALAAMAVAIELTAPVWSKN
jgi:hypothetical protein